MRFYEFSYNSTRAYVFAALRQRDHVVPLSFYFACMYMCATEHLCVPWRMCACGRVLHVEARDEPLVALTLPLTLFF